MKQNKKVAVTGGIGSGKSTALEIIKSFGYPVFSCDEIYSELLKGEELPKLLAEEFGCEILDKNKNLDRQALAKKVFDDEKSLNKLNSITHNKIFEEMFRRAETYNGLVFFEVPLLFEGGYQSLFDEVIVVLRNLENRIESIKVRDKLTDEQIQIRINKQYKYDNDDFAQYYVIHNSGNIDNMRDIIRQILLKLA